MDGSLGSTTALFYAPYDDDPTTSGLLSDPRGLAPRLDRRGRLGRSAGGGPRHRRARQRPRCSTSTTASPGRTARATGASGSSTRSTSGRRTSTASRAAASSPRCSRTTRSTTAAGPRSGSAPSGSRTCTPSARCSTGGASRLRLRLAVAPMDPLLGIYAAVTRRTLDGKNPDGWVPEQKISVEEALRAYTSGDAYGVFAERTARPARTRVQGRPRAARPGPDADRARGDRAGGGAGDGGGRACRISIEIALRRDTRFAG